MSTSTNRNTVSTTERRRLFSRRTRRYMLAYHAIGIKQEEDKAQGSDCNIEKITHSLLEKVVKTSKTHHNVADINKGWILDIVGTMQRPIGLE